MKSFELKLIKRRFVSGLKLLLGLFSIFSTLGCNSEQVSVQPAPEPVVLEEKMPLRILLTQVDVIDFPQTNQGGAGWDPLDNSAPDIKIAIRINGNVAFESQPIINAINTNLYTFTPDQPIEINPKAQLNIALFDEEFWVEPDFMTEAQTGMIWDNFLKGYGYPESLSLKSNDVNYIVHFNYDL